MCHCVVFLGEVCDVGVVDTELGFPHQHVAVAEVDEQIFEGRFKPVFDPYHLESLAVFGNVGVLHFGEQFDNLF